MQDAGITMKRSAIVPGVKKIAVLRANALGDLIFTLPALEALRTAYPRAEIVLLALDWHAAFFAGRPGPVDRCVVVPRCPGVSVPPGAVADADALEQFFAAMARERFDLAIQLHGGGRFSNPFLLRLGAKMTVGLRTPDAVLLDRWVPYVYFQSEILRYLEVVALVGATTAAREPRVALTERDRAEALEIVPETGRPLVALHPGAGDPRRRWPPQKFAAVGDALAAAGASVVVTGIEPERPLVTAVIDGMAQPAQNLCGRLSLGGLAGLLARCQVLVSNDSGPLHLAAAVGAATVGIYWCGNLINADPMTRSRHRPMIAWRLACPVCGRDCMQTTCDHQESFVADVPVEDVVAAALDLL